MFWSTGWRWILEVKTDQDNLIDLKDQLVEEAARFGNDSSQAAREILGADPGLGNAVSKSG